jgi:hypothetical protein
MTDSIAKAKRRRWHQFSLRSLLVLITAMAIGPGGWILYERREARRQKAAAALLGKSGAEVYSRRRWLWSQLESDAPGQVVGIALRDRQTTDAGAAPLADLSDLIWLNLNDTHITDKGLAHVAGLSQLKQLRLDETQVTDEGLVHLARLSHLETLNLSRTQVTDEGLARLSRLTKLKELDLARTRVTDAGVAELQRVLPKLKIDR